MATLLTSEVTANAVRHAATPFEVAVEIDGPELEVEVLDGSGALPKAASVDPVSEGGRRLRILDAFALRWGVRTSHSGKSVWFSLTVDGRSVRGRTPPLSLTL